MCKLELQTLRPPHLHHSRLKAAISRIYSAESVDALKLEKGWTVKA